MSPDPRKPWGFTAYPKMAESLSAFLGDDEAAYRAVDRVDWIVTEKIHGANFCFVTDGAELRCARRKAFLRPDEDFYGHRAIEARLSPAVLRLFALAREGAAPPRRAFVYGELFGGRYPHPRVRPDPTAQPVQAGCWYSPTIEFCAFDLVFEREEPNLRTFVDYDDAVHLFERVGIFHAKPLFRGSWSDASAYPIGFESTIPRALGLPALPPGNLAEGVVLKPAASLAVPGSDAAVRPVIKRKIAAFSEDSRVREAEVCAPRAKPGKDAGALEWLRDEVSARLNENRLNAAASKVGRVDPRDERRLAEVVALVIEDIRGEIEQYHGDRARALSSSDAAALARFIESEVRALVARHLGSPRGRLRER